MPWDEARWVQAREACDGVRGNAGVRPRVIERNKLEAQLRQGQEREATEGLAGGVAHDFDGILGVAGVDGDLLLEGR